MGKKESGRENERGGGWGGAMGGGWPIPATIPHQVIKCLEQHNCRFLWKPSTLTHAHIPTKGSTCCGGKLNVFRPELRTFILLKEKKGSKERWSRAGLDRGQSDKSRQVPTNAEKTGEKFGFTAPRNKEAIVCLRTKACRHFDLVGKRMFNNVWRASGSVFNVCPKSEGLSFWECWPKEWINKRNNQLHLDQALSEPAEVIIEPNLWTKTIK